VTFLDIFALIVLLVLIGAVVAIWVLLGMLPGRIARARNHPQADAINMCGWWGVLTMGILLPLAFIWAYTNSVVKPSPADEKGNEESKP
jgi:uncharacterized BrkB/YihY/UPF0761 family membrane protein